MLLYRNLVVGTALYSGIVRDNDAFTPAHPPYPGNDARRGNVTAVHAVSRQLRQLEKGTAGVQQYTNTLARRELSRGLMLFHRCFGAALCDTLHLTTHSG